MTILVGLYALCITNLAKQYYSSMRLNEANSIVHEINVRA